MTNVLSNKEQWKRKIESPKIIAYENIPNSKNKKITYDPEEKARYDREIVENVNSLMNWLKAGAIDTTKIKKKEEEEEEVLDIKEKCISLDKSRKKYRVRVFVNGVYTDIGRYDSLEEAKFARNKVWKNQRSQKLETM
jgi:predicted transcriptional regulator